MSLPVSSAKPAAVEPIPDEWVRWLFDRLHACFGSKLADLYAGAKPEIVRREWAEALRSYADAEVERGLGACRTRAFAPNLGEFLMLCRPALDPETAWLEAEQGMPIHAGGQCFAWSHPAVYWAARQMQVELRGSNFAAQRKRWTRLMLEQWELGAWASPPDPTVRAIAMRAGDGLLDPQARQRAVDSMRETRAALAQRYADRTGEQL